MVARNTRAPIVKSACPESTTHAGLPDTIAKSLAGQIDSSQVCPGAIIRISGPASTLLSTKETPELVKGLKAVLRCFWIRLLVGVLNGSLGTRRTPCGPVASMFEAAGSFCSCDLSHSFSSW